MSNFLRIIGRFLTLTFTVVYVVVAFIFYVPYAFCCVVTDLDEFKAFASKITDILITLLNVFFQIRSKSQEEQ